MQRTLIIANGNLNARHLMRERIQEWAPTAVIAADGGAQHALALDVEVDVVVGDMDSIREETRTTLADRGVRFEVSPPAKNETDLELALLYAVEKGAEQMVLVAALGSRLDMSMANLLLLTHPALCDADVSLWWGHQTGWLIMPPGDDVHGQPGDTLSLLPLGGDAAHITTHNLEYPLNDESLTHGPARGISNVLSAEHARIELGAGMLLAVHTPGRA